MKIVLPEEFSIDIVYKSLFDLDIDLDVDIGIGIDIDLNVDFGFDIDIDISRECKEYKEKQCYLKYKNEEIEDKRRYEKDLEVMYIDIDNEYINSNIDEKELMCRKKRKRKSNIGIEDESNRKRKKK